jgi:hypothetical protein
MSEQKDASDRDPARSQLTQQQLPALESSRFAIAARAVVRATSDAGSAQVVQLGTRLGGEQNWPGPTAEHLDCSAKVAHAALAEQPEHN